MQTRADNPGGQKGTPGGLTAIELLIALSVLAVIMMVAVPGSNMLMGYYRLTTVSSELVDSLYLARNAALQRASTVRVCPSDDGKSCRLDGDWSQGWLVYTDGNADDKVQDIELLGTFEVPKQHVRIIASGAAQTVAGFTATGLVRDNDSASAEFILCPENFRAGPRAIVVDADGWVSVATADGHLCQAG